MVRSSEVVPWAKIAMGLVTLLRQRTSQWCPCFFVSSLKSAKKVGNDPKSWNYFQGLGWMDLICIHILSDKFLISSDFQICPVPLSPTHQSVDSFWLAFFGRTIDMCVCQNQKLQNRNSSGCPTKMKYQRSYFPETRYDKVWYSFHFQNQNWFWWFELVTVSVHWNSHHLDLSAPIPDNLKSRSLGGFMMRSWIVVVWGTKTLSNWTCVHLVYNSYYQGSHCTDHSSHLYLYPVIYTQLHTFHDRGSCSIPLERQVNILRGSIYSKISE